MRRKTAIPRLYEEEMKTDRIVRRRFLSSIGKGLGLMALSSATVASLWKDVKAAGKAVDHLSPLEVAADEDFWSVIQQSFSVTRGIINLNNGGVSPSPRMVTEAFVRYTWQQEDATAYTMWQILEPQSETVRAGLCGDVRLRQGRDRDHSERKRVARDPFDGYGLEVRRRDTHNDAGLSAYVDDAKATRTPRRPEAQPDQSPDRSRRCRRDRRRIRTLRNGANQAHPDIASDQLDGTDNACQTGLRNGTQAGHRDNS